MLVAMAKHKTPGERLAELQERVKAAKDDLKADERKRYEIVGAAIVSLLQSDPGFKSATLPKLRDAIKSPKDKAAVETLLV